MRRTLNVGGMLLAAALLSLPLAAQTPDVSGTWLADSNGSVKWILEQKDGKIHVQEMRGDKTESDFTCALSGQECSAKENGREEKIMMYFNGAKLVQIRERGEDTLKRWLTVSPDGKTLTVETVPLSSYQKTETLSFRRENS